MLPKTKKDTIIFNRNITIAGVPLKAYDYVVNGRSAIEWLFDRYQVTIDKASLIKNDCNDWSREHKNPRYIYNLVLSIINVSLKTVDIVNALPKVEFGEEEKKEVRFPDFTGEEGFLNVAEPSK